MKHTLIALGCLCPFFSKAQFEVGQKVIGGNVGFSSISGSSSNSSKNTSSFVSISLSLAKFYKPNALHGAEVYYSYAVNKTDDTSSTNNDSKNTQHSIGLNLFAQRFVSLGTKFFFTTKVGGGIGYSFGKNTYSNPSASDQKSHSYSAAINITPGLSYRLNERFLFDAYLNNFLSASYSHDEYESNSPYSSAPYNSNNFNLSFLSNTNLGNVGLGFRWLLKKK